MRALVVLCCLAAAVRASSASASAAKTTRALPPFSALDLGGDGCMPFGLRVVEGPDYALEIVAEDGVAAHVGSKVSPSGSLAVFVSESFRTAKAVAVTLRLPAGSLASLSHAGAAPVLVTAPTAASLTLKSSGSGALHVAAGPVEGGGSVSVTLSGLADVLLCSPSPVQLSALDARLSGTASLQIDGFAADDLAASLSGMGDLTVSGSGDPATQARLTLSGSGKLSAAARKADVALSGMGDIFVSGADAVSGSIAGMGSVRYSPSTATCSVSGFGMGSCSPGDAPPPRLRCGDHDGKEVDAANARGFVVDVQGSQCQVHTP